MSAGTPRDLRGQAQPLAEGQEREIGRRVVEERRERPRRPEELPRRADAQLASALPQQVERGDHGDEDPGEEHGDLHHWPCREGVVAANARRRQRERHGGQREDRQLTPWRAEERHRQHDAYQPHRIEGAVHAQRPDLGAVPPDRPQRLACELHGVVGEERGEEHGKHQPPVREEPQRPREGHAGQVAEEQRRVAERGQHAAHVGHDEDEEDDGVLHPRALAVRL